MIDERRTVANVAITTWIKSDDAVHLHASLGAVPPIARRLNYRRARLQVA